MDEKRNTNVDLASIQEAFNAFSETFGRSPDDGERFVTVFDNCIIVWEWKGQSIFAEVHLEPLRIHKNYEINPVVTEEPQDKETFTEVKSCLS